MKQFRLVNCQLIETKLTLHQSIRCDLRLKHCSGGSAVPRLQSTSSTTTGFVDVLCHEPSKNSPICSFLVGVPQSFALSASVMGAILHLHSVFSTPQLTVCRASLACIHGQLRNNPLTLWECTRNNVGCCFSDLHHPHIKTSYPVQPNRIVEVFIEFDPSLLLF